MEESAEDKEIIEAYRQQFRLILDYNLTLRREIARMSKALCRRRRQRKHLDEKVSKLRDDLVFCREEYYRETKREIVR